MKINRLEYQNFRNLSSGELIADERVNIFFGNNAQGKTNILEAMWLFTGGRSFRGAKDRDLINFDCKKALVKLEFYSRNRLQNSEVVIENQKRGAVLNGVPQKAASSLIGSFCAVVFSPVHLSLVKDGPLGRRKFIDAAICQIKPTYPSLLLRYNHTLLQRNTLIKDIKYHPELLDTLEIWDENLAKYASLIIQNRLKYIDELKKPASEIYNVISDGKENFDISYISCVKETHDLKIIESTIKDKLKKSLKDDLKFGFTNIGPHRDDIDITIDFKSAKNYASQGQQRSAVLSLKLAEADILQKSIDEKPVILLDDVMSELDNKRQDYILNSIKDLQVFITCCEPSTVLRLIEGKKFEINSGNII